MAKTILVVEDNPTDMEILCYFLEMYKYEVIRAKNAEEALWITNTILPDLVVADIKLPGIDGIELTNRLKKEESTKNIPVIAVTAHDMRGEEKNLFKWGFNGYVSKPISKKRILNTVKLFLPSEEEPTEEEPK